VHGFAALRERASVSEAGFALFRRRRLIQGSADEGYRPEFIFGKSNSYRYQRVFGELELTGFAVSHTKDGFAWDENEETFLELLREQMDEPPLRLLEQAEEHRTRQRRNEVQAGAEAATERTARVIEHEVPAVLEWIDSAQAAEIPTPQLQQVPLVAKRVIELEHRGVNWQITLELSDDPGLGDWLEISDTPTSVDPRKIGLRLALAHPFMERFGGATADRLEPLIRIAAAIGLAEITARDSGVKSAGAIRRNVNSLLRDALSKP
jgi:hypothetical protein